jgi:hypothetical protein
MTHTLREVLAPPFNINLDAKIVCRCGWTGEYGDLEYNFKGLSTCPKCGGEKWRMVKI